MLIPLGLPLTADATGASPPIMLIPLGLPLLLMLLGIAYTAANTPGAAATATAAAGASPLCFPLSLSQP